MSCACPLFAEIKGDIELLLLIADGYEANLAKLRTWRGKATLKAFHTPIPSTDWGERRWESQNEFLLDRSQEAIRWRGETLKGTQTLEGKTSQIPPSVQSGMIKSGYNYRLALPDDEKERGTLLVIPSGRGPRNLESDVFDPVHILTKEICPGLVEQLRGYHRLQSEGKLHFSNGSITRDGDLVTVETDNERGGNVGRITTRFVFDLSKGCSLVEFLNSSKPSESHWKLDYEEIADVLVMKQVALTYKDKREGHEYVSTREAILTNEMVNEPVDPNEFTFAKLGMRPGDGVFDRVMGGISYDWKKEQTSHEALEKAVTTGSRGTGIAPTKPALTWRDAETRKVLFTSDDIVSFDWDKQVFLLELEPTIDFLVWIHQRQSRRLLVEDADGPIYKAHWVSWTSSAGFGGPIYQPLSPNPFFSIENGYPKRQDCEARDNDARFADRLKAGLQKAGVLESIWLDRKHFGLRIRTTPRRWRNVGEDMKISVEYFENTFRPGGKVRAHVFFAGGEKTRGLIDSVTFRITLIANRGTFRSDVRLDPVAVCEIEDDIHVCRFAPWEPAEGSDREIEPGAAEVYLSVLLQKQSRTLYRLDFPASRVEIGFRIGAEESSCKESVRGCVGY